jgi:CRISPR/Cas system-associated endoribonuclease Cas2
MNRWQVWALTGLMAGALGLNPVAAAAQVVSDPNIDQRQMRQQQRIQQGVQSGQLTPQEAQRLQKEQGRIAAKEARMQADGNLTPKERAKLNKRLDKSSRRINKAMHNKQQVNP